MTTQAFRMLPPLSTLVLIVLADASPRSAFAADVCSKTRHFFVKRGVLDTSVFSAEAAQGDTSAAIEGQCLGSARCCSARAVPTLDKLSKRTYHDYLREALNDAQTTLRKLANQIKGTLCHQLQESRNTSDSQMTQNYGIIYVQHRHTFLSFMCSINKVALNCKKCHSAVKNETELFIRKVQLLLIKLKTGHQQLRQESEECALNHLVIHPKFGRGILRKLTKDLQESVCTSCELQQALNAAADLIHKSRTAQPSRSCLSSLQCMTSCSCCRGDKNCGLNPCYGCCMSSLQPCMSSFVKIHPTFQSAMKTIVQYSRQLHTTNSIDSVFNRLPSRMADIIKYGLDTVDDQQKVLESHCGDLFGARFMPSPAVAVMHTCSCQQNALPTLRQAFHRVSEVKWLQNTLGSLADAVCQRRSISSSANCQNCTTCQQALHEDRQLAELSPLSEHLKVFRNSLPTFYQQKVIKSERAGTKLPLAVKSRESSSGDCDDEDSDCASGGSGDRKHQIVMDQTEIASLGDAKPSSNQLHVPTDQTALKNQVRTVIPHDVPDVFASDQSAATHAHHYTKTDKSKALQSHLDDMQSNAVSSPEPRTHTGTAPLRGVINIDQSSSCRSAKQPCSLLAFCVIIVSVLIPTMLLSSWL